MAEPRKTRLNRRPGRNAENVVEQKKPEADFSEAQKRSDYLKHKLDDILENIGKSYGKRMADELMKRLEKTIVEFNAEVVDMLDKLEVLEEQRLKELSPDQKSETLPETDTTEPSDGESAELEDEFANMSEFEKRIEMLERQKKEADKKGKDAKEESEEKPKKRGLFRKKNK